MALVRAGKTHTAAAMTYLVTRYRIEPQQTEDPDQTTAALVDVSPFGLEDTFLVSGDTFNDFTPDEASELKALVDAM